MPPGQRCHQQHRRHRGAGAPYPPLSRTRFEMFADNNPLMSLVVAWAARVRTHRRPARPDDAVLDFERAMSDAMAGVLQGLGNGTRRPRRGAVLCRLWLSIAADTGGLGADVTWLSHRIERDLAREAAGAQMAAELERNVDRGRLIEAAIRALIDVRRLRAASMSAVFQRSRKSAQVFHPPKRVGYARFPGRYGPSSSNGGGVAI